MRVDELIEDAKTQVREVLPAAIAKSLHRYIILDVPEPREILHGYLSGAINMPRGTVEFRVTDDERFGDKGQPILVYSGNGNRSALVALSLEQLGFSNVQSLAGGIDQWSLEDRPIE